MSSGTESDVELEYLPSTDPLIFTSNIPLTTYQHQDVIDAVKKIEQIDVQAVGLDRQLEEEIASAYTVISTFLDNIREGSSTILDNRSCSLKAFLAIGNISFLKILFTHRARCYQLAAQLCDSHDSTSTIVCWVDFVLAKLGEAVLFICTGFSYDLLSATSYGGPLKAKQDDDAVQGASQLPENWLALGEITDAKKSSPSARRLALRLLFIAHIFQPQLTGDKFEDATSAYIIGPLQSSINLQVDLSTTIGSSMRERICSAITVVLYFTMAKREQTSHPFRPHTYSILLESIRSILSPDPLLSDESAIGPLEQLDVAQTILIRFGDVIPSCWVIWNEQWLNNPETVVLLSTTWLYHIDQSSPASDTVLKGEIRLPDVLFSNPQAAMSALLQILCKMEAFLASEESLCPASLNVLFKTCWAVIEVYKKLPVNAGNAPMTKEVARSIGKIFVCLGEDEVAIQIKDLTIEVLALLDEEPRKDGLRQLVRDKRKGFTSKLDTAMTHCKSIMSSAQDNITAVTSMKLYLDLLCILWRDGVYEGTSHQAANRPLVSSLIYIVKDGSPELIEILQDKLLVLLSVLRRCTAGSKFPVFWNEEMVWQIAYRAPSTHLINASAFSQLVLSSTKDKFVCSPTTCAAAWERLKDALLLIIARAFFADDEVLALIVSPIICRALIELVENSTIGAVRFMILSSWTRTLKAELERLFHDEVRDDREDAGLSLWDEDLTAYRTMLKSKLEMQGRILLRLIEQKTLSPTESSLPEISEMTFDWRVCFIPPCSRLLLLPRA